MNPTLIALAALAATLSAPALAQDEARTTLLGVSDEETTIPYVGEGSIRDFQFGNGDVMFVRDRTERWYRVELNEGCLSRRSGSPAVAFDVGSGSRLDQSSKVYFTSPRATCLVNSIRRSEAPPQVDSESRVTLD